MTNKSDTCRILLAHPKTEDHTLLLKKLQDQHFNIQTAYTTEDLLHKAKAWSPYLIISSDQMSNITPIDLIKRVQEITSFGLQASKWDHVMTAILTANLDTNYITSMLEDGVDEVLTSPLDLALANARIHALLRQRKLYDQIKRHNLKLEELSIQDELTGLFKMTYVQNRLSEEVQRSRRNNSALSCIMMDIDQMKQVIDQFDHSLANQVVGEVGRLISKNTRHIDICGHHGGDEFVIILPDATIENTKQVAKRLLNAMKNKKFQHGRKEIKLTACFGLSTIDHIFQDEGSNLLRRAERALEQAKKLGLASIAIDH